MEGSLHAEGVERPGSKKRGVEVGREGVASWLLVTAVAKQSTCEGWSLRTHLGTNLTGSHG